MPAELNRHRLTKRNILFRIGYRRKTIEIEIITKRDDKNIKYVFFLLLVFFYYHPFLKTILIHSKFSHNTEL